MTKKQFKLWLIRRLGEVEQTIDRPATAREADTVYEAKRYAYELGLRPLADMMPERDLKTPLDCCLRLHECLDYLRNLENPPSVPVDDNAWLSLKQAAAYLGYKTEGFRPIVAQGRVQFERNGERGRYKFRRAWLDEFRRTIGGGPESIDRSPAQRREMPIAFDLRPNFDPSFFQSDS